MTLVLTLAFITKPLRRVDFYRAGPRNVWVRAVRHQPRVPKVHRLSCHPSRCDIGQRVPILPGARCGSARTRRQRATSAPEFQDVAQRTPGRGGNVSL